MKKIFLLTALIGLFTVSFASESTVDFTDNPVAYDISADAQVDFVAPVDCVGYEFTGTIESFTVATNVVANYTEVGGFDIDNYVNGNWLLEPNLFTLTNTNFDLPKPEPSWITNSITNRDNFNLTNSDFNKRITVNVGKLTIPLA